MWRFVARGASMTPRHGVLLQTTLALASAASVARAIDNGLGRTPPMGWRSWNCYHGSTTQAKMTAATDAMVSPSRGVSLLAAGYNNVGLDDVWQACGAGVNGSFHNATGYPLVDKAKFPSMKAMTDHAHALGLRMGWYGNNCACSEHSDVWGTPVSPGQRDGIHHYEGDVQATIDFGFDGIKLDGCGEFRNMTVFAELMNMSGRPILVEECHGGHPDGPGDWGDGSPSGWVPGVPNLNQGHNQVPAEKWCPMNFFRTSSDIRANWGSIFHNLQSVDKYQPWNGTKEEVLTGPGCFACECIATNVLSAPPQLRCNSCPLRWLLPADPDMMEVGKLASFEEDRAHFGAWVVVSSPLILGHDLVDDTINDLIWPIITNPLAIRISQSFAEGDAFHPGGLVRSFDPAGAGTVYPWAVPAVNATDGWSIHGDGTVQHGGLCLTAGDVPSLSECLPCRAVDQLLTLEKNGNLRRTGGDQKCVVLALPNLNALRMYGCKNGSAGYNEEWSLRDGKLCSHDGHDGSRQVCMSPKAVAPPGAQGDGKHAAKQVQIWAKPQPYGAVAALVLNNQDPGCGNVSVTVTFEEIRLMHTGDVTVANVWEPAVPATVLAKGATSFETASIGSHDSVFLLFSPISKNASRVSVD
jgi:hypothetical protein